MKIVFSAGECLKLRNDYKAMAKLLKASGEDVKDITGTELLEKFKSKVSLAKIQLDGSVVYEIDEEFAKDIFDLVNHGYFSEIIKNLNVIKPCVKFLEAMFKSISDRTKALHEKWFADANGSEKMEDDVKETTLECPFDF